jgi:hypothetical protein
LGPSTNDNSSSAQAVKIREAAYDDIAGLTATLRDQDALIEAFNTAAAIHQRTIVRAALAAGIKHLVTSEFGLDTFHPNASQLPCSDIKLEAQRALEEELQKAVGNGNSTPLTWTGIFVGPWYDWGIRKGNFWLDRASHTITRLGSGDQKVSMSRLALNGEAVVTVLREPERFRNRPAYFSNHTVSVNGIISLVKEISDESEGPWIINDVPDIEVVKNEGLRLWNDDTKNGVENRLHSAAYLNLATAALYDENNAFGADFSHKQEPGWDEGLEKLKDNLKLLLNETSS